MSSFVKKKKPLKAKVSQLLRRASTEGKFMNGHLHQEAKVSKVEHKVCGLADDQYSSSESAILPSTPRLWWPFPWKPTTGWTASIRIFPYFTVKDKWYSSWTGFDAVFLCQQGTGLDDSTGDEEEEEEGREAQCEEADGTGFVCFYFTWSMTSEKVIMAMLILNKPILSKALGFLV